MERLLARLLAGSVFAVLATAQCQPAPSWSVDTAAPQGSVSTLLAHSNGDLFAAGPFTSLGGTAANGIAFRRAGQWQPLGSGVIGNVTCLAELPGGDLIVGGSLSAAGGVPVANIARWDGTNWSPLGAGLDGAVAIARVAANGELIVGGQFNQAGGMAAPFLARWNGSNWAMFPGGPSATVTALAIAANGDVLANGFPNGIARWNGSSWQPLGSASFVYSVFETNTGELLAGIGNSVTRWNGSAWNAEIVLSGGLVRALGMLQLPGGELLVFGGFQTFGVPGGTSSVAARGVAVRRGLAWSGNGSSTGMPGWTQFHSIRSASLGRSGDVMMAGFLPAALPSNPAVAIQRLGTTCAASVLDLGGACTGPNGSGLLVAATLPWLGTTFRAEASQLPMPALAATVFGFAAVQVPLVGILPTALPGCDLLVTPDLLATPFAPAGTASMAVDLPSTSALAGLPLFAQVVAIELAPSGAFLAVTGTNALRATLGSY